MKARLDVPVVLANDYDKLVSWYSSAMPLQIGQRVTEGYHYTCFVNSGKGVLGIADAKEMGVTPREPRENTVIVQLVVSDIFSLFAEIEKRGGTVLFGPKTDEASDDYYGGFLDIEGNQIWVSENKKLAELSDY